MYDCASQRTGCSPASQREAAARCVHPRSGSRGSLLAADGATSTRVGNVGGARPACLPSRGGDAPDWRTVTMAHVLSIDGAACRRSVLALAGLLAPPESPEVVVVRRRRTAARAPAPSTDRLDALDLDVLEGIPTTTVTRALIDAAGRIPRVLFEDVFDTAIVQRLTTAARLRDRAEALWAPRRNGCAIVLSCSMPGTRASIGLPTSGKPRCCGSCARSDSRSPRSTIGSASAGGCATSTWPGPT